MKKNIWPYQNKLQKDLPGELWKDIPGFDGEYEISNMGRVKSLRRWRASGRHTGYYTKEKILQQHVRRKKNQVIGKYTYTVSNTLKKNGKSISKVTARYVYHVFADSFDLENKSLMISYKDFEGRNLHYENLFMTNRSDIQKKSYRSKRSQPKFCEYRLPVRQVAMNGKIIASYVSLKEAEEKTGIGLTAIAACVDGRTYQSHGFRWISPSKKAVHPIAQGDSKKYFNEYLWKKLGKPRTSRAIPIAALNLHPENMKGERWKPIEGLEDAFLISNLGRVKALPRFKEGKMQVWTKGKVKRLIPDGKTSKPTSCLLASFTKKGKKIQQSVGRLVYHHFSKRIDLSNSKVRIGYKNKKHYDLDFKNLFLKIN